MTLRVRLTLEAQADIDEAQRWYEGAEAGLGARFLDAVEEFLRLAVDWPDTAPLVHPPDREVESPT